ncbi:MAG: flagellar biosynthesis repressor FlbT [Pseudomonadota bacterium]
MRVHVKSGERLFVNGAVLRFSNRGSVEFMNDADFLLEHHVLQPDEAQTPVAQLYLAVQALVIDPVMRATNRARVEAMLAANGEGETYRQVERLVKRGRFLDAMKVLRPHLHEDRAA